MIFRMFVAGLALALAACAQPSVPAPDNPVVSGPEKVPSLDTETACKAYGGNWQPVCLRGNPACVVTFKDAGKSCSDSSECSGRCTVTPGSVPSGTQTRGACTPNSNPCGCFQLVVNGKADFALCVD
jgi:hypothetical protein